MGRKKGRKIGVSGGRSLTLHGKESPLTLYQNMVDEHQGEIHLLFWTSSQRVIWFVDVIMHQHTSFGFD